MNRLTRLLFLTCITSAEFVHAEDALPKTLMTERGKLLASENFVKPLPPFTGKAVGCASGFTGWQKFPMVRAPTPVKPGEWHTVVLEIKGEELVASLDGKRTSTASCLASEPGPASATSACGRRCRILSGRRTSGRFWRQATPPCRMSSALANISSPKQNEKDESL